MKIFISFKFTGEDLTTTFLRQLAETLVEYDSYDDLHAKLRELK